MSFIYHFNAKLIKLLVCFVLLSYNTDLLFAQEEGEPEGGDPITEAVNRKKQDYIGMNFRKNEQKELERINTKYELTKEEKKLRMAYRDTLTLIEKYKVGRSNRKLYLKEKKLKEFRKKVILNRQPETTRKRMEENQKRTKTKYKKKKRKQKKKKFFNLFR